MLGCVAGLIVEVRDPGGCGDDGKSWVYLLQPDQEIGPCGLRRRIEDVVDWDGGVSDLRGGSWERDLENGFGGDVDG